jgi:hypothetical protein
MAKKKNPVTPVAPCLWPFLNKPDTRYNKDGVFRVSLEFDQDDEFPKLVEKAAKKAFEEAKANMKPKEAKKLEFFNPVRDIEDEEGEPTGNVKIEFKTYATFKDQKTGEVRNVRLNAYDAEGKPLKKIPQIGNGSLLSIAFNPVGKATSGKFYYTLYLNAFQLVELHEFNPDGSAFGFGKHEGFKAQDAEESNPFDDDDAADDDDDDDIPF